MGLLDKTNPQATLLSTLRHAIVCAACGLVCYFFCFEKAAEGLWSGRLLTWLLICAFVGAIWEWQVAD